MNRTKATAATAALLLAAGIVFAGATPATAATPDFSPSVNGPRQFMINVLGSVLGKAAPKGWRAEQIANEYKFNHSWDELAARTGIRSDATPGQMITTDWSTMPQTKADYDLLRAEQALYGSTQGQASNTTGNKRGTPLRVPATTATKLLNGVGAAAGVVTTGAIGVQVGAGITTMFGIDGNGLVCAAAHDNPLGGMLSMLSGQDCSTYDFDPTFEANKGIVPGQLGAVSQCKRSGQPAVVTGVALPNPDCRGGSVGFVRNGYPFRAGGPAVVAEFSETANPRTVKARITVGQSAGAPAADGRSISLPNVGIYCLDSAGIIRSTAGSFSPTVKFPQTDGAAYDQSFTVALPSVSTSCAMIGARIQTLDSTGALVHGFVYKSGQPMAPLVVTEADPDRQLQCSIVGDNGATYTQLSAVFKETGDATAAAQCPVLPDGVRPANVKIDEVGGGETKTLSDQPVSTEYANWWDTYPECRTGACKLDLIKKGGAPVSCFDLDAACADWFAQPNKADLYQCRYGQHDVALAECNVYEGVFKKERQTVGAPYSDPMTGEWSGGQSSPKPDADAMSQSLQDPAARRACTGMNVTGFDPVGFVMRPIQCALEWAFVPRVAVVELEAVKMQDAWSDTPPGTFVTTMGTFEIEMASSCAGYPVTMLGKTFNIGAACSGVFKDFADRVRPITSILAGFAGLFGISSSVGSVIGFRKLGD